MPVFQNLCETRPVVFTKLIPDELGMQSNLRAGRKEGFRVKQRKKNKAGIDGREQENKVTVITIDSKTRDDEEKVNNLTVEDVIKMNTSGKSMEKQNGHFEEIEKHSVSFSFAETDPRDVHDSLLSQSKVSIADSVSSSGSEQKHVKVKPSQPTFGPKNQEVDLDIIGTLSVPNGQRPLSSESEQQASIYSNKNPYAPRPVQTRAGSARSSRSALKSAKSQKSIGSGSLVSIGGQGYRQNQNEAEYIQIAHPVKNPNSSSSVKRPTEYASPNISRESPRNHRGYSGVREPVPSPELQPVEAVEQANELVTKPPAVEMKPVPKAPAPALSISIPTADYTDSALNSPTHKHAGGSDTSPQMKRANHMRDEQIDQITDLLVDAIIGPNDKGGGKS